MNNQIPNRHRYRAWLPLNEAYDGICEPHKTRFLSPRPKMSLPWDVGTDEWHGFFAHEHPNAIYLQSTGMADKNGQEIFESDILEYQDAMMDNGVWRPIVDWYEDGLQWVLRDHLGDDGGYLLGNKFGTDPMDLAEVIGNIYENPELLEEEK